MEPETSSSKIGLEHNSIERESAPEQLKEQHTTPEAGITNGGERHEQASEPSVVKSDTSGLSGIFPSPVITDDQVVTDDSSVSSLVPMIASDDDLIEKEWVDRAKKIVADNRDDPYKQEKAVGELQKDYQKKRYGRETGGA